MLIKIIFSAYMGYNESVSQLPFSMWSLGNDADGTQIPYNSGSSLLSGSHNSRHAEIFVSQVTESHGVCFHPIRKLNASTGRTEFELSTGTVSYRWHTHYCE